MSTITYVGHRVEIEDDVVRMRRMLESADDLARNVRRSERGRRRKAPGPARAMLAVVARWR